MLLRLALSAIFLMECLYALTDDELAVFIANGVTVTYPNSRIYWFESDGYPSDEVAAQFPMIPGNPHAVVATAYSKRIPVSPTQLDEPECLYSGQVGMTVTGLPFFNPFTSSGTDAVEEEKMGMCNGHPNAVGAYHFHGINNCTYTGEANQLLGVANDGYPIYGPADHDTDLVSEDSLDNCHGRTDDDLGYHYRITYTFPYIIGCYTAEPKNIPGAATCAMKKKSLDFEREMLKALVEVEELKLKEQELQTKKKEMKLKVKNLINRGYMEAIED